MDLFTRVLLQSNLWAGTLLWFSFGFIEASNAGLAVPAHVSLASLGGCLFLTAVCSSTMRAMTALAPSSAQRRPFPRRRIVALAIGNVVFFGLFGLTADPLVRANVALLVVQNLSFALSGLPGRLIVVGLLAGSALFCTVNAGPWFSLFNGLLNCSGAIITVRAATWLNRTVAELDANRHTQASLAVAEERLRFSQDVHDVLGRYLSTIAVQAELATALANRGDDEGAGAQMLRVRQSALNAMAEADELARGYHPTSLPQELESARTLLSSAGIETTLDIGDIPQPWQEAAAWVVRESVTNVLRHSKAGWVRITYHNGELRILNDGIKPTARPGNGSGLLGLRERLEPMGGRVEAGRDGPYWVVVARLPATGPLRAAAPTEPARGVL
ncbi:hypothetical protein GCM10027456_43320 [Kineosporia babensis]